MFDFDNLQEKVFNINNIHIHFKCGGNKEKEALIFLHGFPEFWYGWKNQIPYFIEKEYFVVVPDLRGYNLSSKPKGVKQYRIDQLAMDIVLLIKSISKEKVLLVGHDWGGIIGWVIAMENPELIKKVVFLNIPHPGIVIPFMKRNPLQIFKSAYIGFFQLPFIPELILKAFNYYFLKNALVLTAEKETFSDHDLDMYIKAWQQTGAITAMLNWYRALKYQKPGRRNEVIIPTLLIWGKKDAFLSQDLAKISIKKCKDGKLVFLDATHWLHHEKSKEVNQLIYDFIKN